MQNVATETPTNAGLRNRPMSSMGRACLSSTTTKIASRTAPPTSEPTMSALVQPLALPRSTPKTVRKSAAEKVRSPQTSARTACSSRDSPIFVSATNIANAPTGTLTKNTQRQPSVSVRRPPTSGPDATAAPTVAPQIAIAPPMSGPRYSCPIRARAVANRAAPPMPCSARATSSTAMFQASPQSSDAVLKTSTPIMKTSRRP